MTTLGDVLTFAGEPEKISDPANEMFVTVRLNGGGAVRRPIGAGKTPVPFTGYRISAGQLIYSRIDARNGAFAVVPAQLDGAVVSKDFPVFFIRDDRVDPGYLNHFLRGGSLQRLIRASSLGATNRQRISEERLLSFTLPLPSLPEQRRIAAILDQADALRAKRHDCLGMLSELANDAFHRIAANARERSTLYDLGVDFLSGRNVLGSDLDAHRSNRVLKVSAISSGSFVPSESKPMPSEYRPPESHRVHRGDVLFGRASGSLDLLGATAVVDVDTENLYLPDKVWKLVVPPHVPVIDAFVLGILRSDDAREFIRHNASGAAGVRNISKAKLLSYVAPVPPIELQREFAARVAAINAQRAAAERSLASLDELFVSLQARAFSGQL